MNLTNMQTVRTLLEQHGFHFSKKLGQNFLINVNVVNEIIEKSDVNKNDLIIEIGPGLGTLTARIA